MTKNDGIIEKIKSIFQKGKANNTCTEVSKKQPPNNTQLPASIINKVELNFNGPADISNTNIGIIVSTNNSDILPNVDKLSKLIIDIKKLLSEYKNSEVISLIESFIKFSGVDIETDKEAKLLIDSYLVIAHTNREDYTTAKPIVQRLEQQRKSQKELTYKALFPFYFNQQFLDKAYDIAYEGVGLFPNCFELKARYALICEILNKEDEIGDPALWLEHLWSLAQSDSKDIDNNESKIFFETLAMIYYKRHNLPSLISLCNNDIFPATLTIKALLIKEKYYSSIRKAISVSERIDRSLIDYEMLFSTYKDIVELETSCQDIEKDEFYRLIGTEYSGCLVLLNRGNEVVEKNLLSTIHDSSNFQSILSSVFLQDRTVLKKLGIEGNSFFETANKIEDLYNACKYEEIITILWPEIKTKEDYKTYFSKILLLACLHSNNKSLFVDVIKYYKTCDLFDDTCAFIEEVYVFDNESEDRAIHNIICIAEKSLDIYLIIDILKFLFAKKLYSISFDIASKAYENKTSICLLNIEGFIDIFLKILVKTEDWESLNKLFSQIDSLAISEKLSLSIKHMKYFAIRDYDRIAEICEKLFDITGEIQYLIEATQIFLALYRLERAERCIVIINRKTDIYTSNFYKTLCQFHILNHENDKALTIASQIKDRVTDSPDDDAHAFYFSLVLRTGDQDKLGYVYEYSQKYPQHRKWFREMRIIEEKGDGVKELTDEAKTFFEQLRSSYELVMENYYNSKIGLSLLLDHYSWPISQLFWMLKKVKINKGNIENLKIELDLKLDEIVIDPIALFLLNKLGILSILKTFQKIYISYSSILSLSTNLLMHEDENIREVLTFITTTTNVIVECPDQQLKKKNESLYFSKTSGKLFECSFFDSIVDSCIIALRNNINYVYGDTNGYDLSQYFKCGSASILSLVKKIKNSKGFDPVAYGEIFIKLFEYKCEFINVDGNDLYCALKANNFCLDDNIKRILEINLKGNVESYIFAYTNFLFRINKHHKIEMLQEMIFSILEAFDKRYGRTRFHLDYANNFQEKLYYIGIRIECTIGASIALSMIVESYSGDQIRAIIQKHCSRMTVEHREYILEKSYEFFEKFHKLMKERLSEELL